MIKLQGVTTFLARLSKREKFFLTVASVTVSVSVLVRLIIFPVYGKIKSLDSEIKEKEAGISKNIRILTHKERIAGESVKFSSYLSKTATDEEAMTSLLKEIESLANKSSLSIADMKPAGVREEKDKTRRFLVNVSCEGEMEQIMEFMYSIENSQSLLTIERYQISPKSKESAIAQCTISITKIVM